MDKDTKIIDKIKKNEEDTNETVVKTEAVPEWAAKLMEENKKMSEKIKMFEDLAGKNTIASYNEVNKDKSTKLCTFKEIDGKLVVGWSALDLSHFQPRALDAYGENIFIELTFDDGEKKKVNYMDFVRCNKLVKCELIKSGGEISTVKLPDGQVTEIPTKFLNA